MNLVVSSERTFQFPCKAGIQQLKEVLDISGHALCRHFNGTMHLHCNCSLVLAPTTYICRFVSELIRASSSGSAVCSASSPATIAWALARTKQKRKFVEAERQQLEALAAHCGDRYFGAGADRCQFGRLAGYYAAGVQVSSCFPPLLLLVATCDVHSLLSLPALTSCGRQVDTHTSCLPAALTFCFPYPPSTSTWDLHSS